MIRNYLLAAGLSLSASAYAATDFGAANSLFELRETKTEEARDAYLELAEKASGEDRLFALSQVGRLYVYQAEVQNPNYNNRVKRKLYRECMNIMDNIKGDSEEYFTWKTACYVGFIRNANFFELVYHYIPFNRFVDKAEDTFRVNGTFTSTLEGNALAMHLSTVFADKYGSTFGLYDMNHAEAYARQALEADAHDGTDLTGRDYYENVVNLVNVLLHEDINKPTEAKSLLLEYIPMIQEQLASNTLPAGREIESEFYYGQMLTLARLMNIDIDADTDTPVPDDQLDPSDKLAEINDIYMARETRAQEAIDRYLEVATELEGEDKAFAFQQVGRLYYYLAEIKDPGLDDKQKKAFFEQCLKDMESIKSEEETYYTWRMTCFTFSARYSSTIEKLRRIKQFKELINNIETKFVDAGTFTSNLEGAAMARYVAAVYANDAGKPFDLFKPETAELYARQAFESGEREYRLYGSMSGIDFYENAYILAEVLMLPELNKMDDAKNLVLEVMPILDQHIKDQTLANARAEEGKVAFIRLAEIAKTLGLEADLAAANITL